MRREATPAAPSSVNAAVGEGSAGLPDTEINATCGVGLGQWHRILLERVDPLTALEPTITAPATARLGADLDFVVTLTNPTPQAITLDPCPGYIASLNMKIKNVSRHRLNCFDSQGRARVIPAGGSLSFAIRLPLPTSDAGLGTADPGTSALVWMISTGQSATTSVNLIVP